MPRYHATSGLKEGELLGRARELRKDYRPLLPTCRGEAPPETFDRLRKALEAVQEVRDDAGALKKLSTRGDDLARAYAGLLHWAREKPELSTLVVRTPSGSIPYLPVAPADPEALIAVQYYDDPRRLLHGYLKYARGSLFGGGGYHFYALERGIVCTGRSADPPPEFVRSTLDRLPYRLSPGTGKEGEAIRQCPHLLRGEREAHIRLRWLSAGLTLEVCRRCAKPDVHLLSAVSENMAIPHVEADFTVETVYPLEHVHPGSCPLATIPPLLASEEKRYRSGKVSDEELLSDLTNAMQAHLSGQRERILVAGGTCFGTDLEAAVEGLHADPMEARALKAALEERTGPLVVAEPTVGKVLEALWKEHAETLLQAVGAPAEEAARLARENRSPVGRVNDLLTRVARRHRELDKLAELPRYRDLVPEAALADSLGRLYRTQGGGAVERRIAQVNPADGKLRGLAWAFLCALGRGENQSWRYSDTEREFGEILIPKVRRLLEAEPGGYHAALADLLTEAGVSWWGERVDGEPPPG